MRGVLFLILMAMPVLIWGQEQKSETGRFRAGLTGGLLFGESDPALLVQLSGGVERRNLYTGVGISYDPHELNSFPLFAEIRWSFFPKKTVLVYGYGGINLPGSYPKEEEFLKTSDLMKAGLYFDGGFAYRINASNTHRFILSAGYGIKQSTREKTFAGNCGGMFPCTEPQHNFRYRYRTGRVVVKLGWELGKW
jgi:hypothetical protein